MMMPPNILDPKDPSSVDRQIELLDLWVKSMKAAVIIALVMFPIIIWFIG